MNYCRNLTNELVEYLILAVNLTNEILEYLILAVFNTCSKFDK